MGYYDILELLKKQLQNINNEQEYLKKQKDIALSTEDIAMEFNIGIILVVHPRQIQGEPRELTINDLKGSSAIKQYADNIILLTRMETIDANQVNKVKVKVVKNRLLGIQSFLMLNYLKENDSYCEETYENLRRHTRWSDYDGN